MKFYSTTLVRFYAPCIIWAESREEAQKVLVDDGFSDHLVGPELDPAKDGREYPKTIYMMAATIELAHEMGRVWNNI